MRLNTTLPVSLLLLSLLAACGDEETPSTGTDAGMPDDVEGSGDEEPTRDIGFPDTAPEDTNPPVPDVPEMDTTPPIDVVPPDTGGGNAICGNGVREQGEVCDGDQILSGATCAAIVTGAIGGELACQANCTFDTSGCFLQLCGDGQISGTEECDGALLNDATCVTLDFAPDVPDAAVTCIAAGESGECTYDTSTCRDQYCGNNNVESPEVCDGDDLGTVSCRSEGFYSGDVTCATDCNSADTSACVENVCGNGTVEGPEVCDGSLFEVTCRDIALPEGTEPPGEGSSDGSGEGSGTEPEGANPGFYVGGVLGCADSCGTIDTSGCIAFIEELGADRDGDFVPDEDDNCPDIANPRQLDADNDGTGNVCDSPVAFTVLSDVEDTGSLDVTLSFGAVLGGLITVPPAPATLELSAASAEIAFDDDGNARLVGMELTIAASSVEVALPDLGGGGGLPIPIPIELPESVTIDVTSGSIRAVDGPTGEADLTGSTFEQYFAGVISSPVASFTVSSTINAGTPVTGSLDGTVADVELAYEQLILTFNDNNAALGVIPVDLLGGGGLPLPIPLPGFGAVDAQVVGVSGSVVIELP